MQASCFPLCRPKRAEGNRGVSRFDSEGASARNSRADAQYVQLAADSRNDADEGASADRYRRASGAAGAGKGKPSGRM